MQVLRLRLQNFRNFPSLDWEPAPEVNIITGENAQGKTNLLEALFFGLTGRSFRTATERDVVRWGSAFCRVELEVAGTGRHALVVASLTSDGRKKLLVDGKAGRPVELCGEPVIFTPEHLWLVKGGPALRRRWLDLEICSLQPGYVRCLRRYQQVLAHRNRLLLGLRGREGGHEALEPWDRQLVELGARIIFWRRRLLAGFASLASQVYSAISAEKEVLSLAYLSSFPLESAREEEELRLLFLRELARRLPQELAWGQTLVGPHRDDVRFSINGRDARRYASLGQQRTTVLALKLAQLELAARLLNCYPLLLLDDVFSEIDERRREALLGYLAGKTQVFLTTSLERSALPPASGCIFEVRRSTITQGG